MPARIVIEIDETVTLEELEQMMRVVKTAMKKQGNFKEIHFEFSF